MSAVNANSLVAMGEVWGTERGPAVSYMDREVLEKRLTIIRSYLVHDSYELLEASASALGMTSDRRVVQVRLVRQGCTPTVPFTVVRSGSGWLVSDIDLSAAGNPQARCR